MSDEKIRKKITDTNLERYGVKYPFQSEETIKLFYTCKKYENTELYYQSLYEKDFLDKYFNSIIIKRGFLIKYDFNKTQKYYYPDFYIVEYNLIIEIKSNYWYTKNLECNLKKKQKCLDNGYNFIFIIDKNYDEFEKIIKSYPSL